MMSPLLVAYLLLAILIILSE